MVVNFILKTLYILGITKENGFHFLVRLPLFTVEPNISLLLRFKSIFFHSRAASSISNPTFRSSPLQISKMDGNGGSINELWEWNEEDYSLQSLPENDLSHLWNETSLMNVLNEKTPIKECNEFADGLLNIKELNTGNTDVDLEEESRELSLLKRRRMLQYDSSETNMFIGSEQRYSSTTVLSEVREESDSQNCLHEKMQWGDKFSGDGCTIDHKGSLNLDQSSKDQATGYCGNFDMNTWCSEMMSCDFNNREINGRDCCNSHFVSEMAPRKDKATPSSRIKFKGKRPSSFKESQAKPSTSVVFPFTHCKPSGSQGDVTLNDINQRIHSPSPLMSSISRLVNEVEPSVHLKSAFTGKPVISKTKILTEGGKGSIIVMITKG